MPGELADEHVVAICQVLSTHHVSFVIIGGIAARLHQTGYATVDVDRADGCRARSGRGFLVVITPFRSVHRML